MTFIITKDIFNDGIVEEKIVFITNSKGKAFEFFDNATNLFQSADINTFDKIADDIFYNRETKYKHYGFFATDLIMIPKHE